MSKKTIMLVCSAGMSTSLLVTKMQKAAFNQGLDAIYLRLLHRKQTQI